MTRVALGTSVLADGKVVWSKSWFCDRCRKRREQRYAHVEPDPHPRG